MLRNTNFICSNREKILNSLSVVENMKKIVDLNNDVARIVLEETIAVNWKQVKYIIKNLKLLLPTIQNTVLWNIPQMQDLVVFTESTLRGSDKSPCQFADFLEKVLHQEIMVNLKIDKV